MKIRVLFLSPVLLAVALALSPMDFAEVKTPQIQKLDSPKFDYESLYSQDFLLDSDILSEKLTTFSSKLKDCVNSKDATAIDKFHDCAGENYSNIGTKIDQFVSQASSLMLDKFKLKLDSFCGKFQINNCYEVQSAVRFAVFTHADPIESVEKIFKISDLKEESPMKAALLELKQNYQVVSKLDSKARLEKQQLVDHYIKTFREENLADSLNWRRNPFRLSQEQTTLLESELTQLGDRGGASKFQSEDALLQEKMDQADLEKSNNFGVSRLADEEHVSMGSQNLNEVTSSLSENDIRLNALKPAGLFPVPSAEELTEMSRMDPDLVLTSKQKRQLKLVRHVNIV